MSYWISKKSSKLTMLSVVYDGIQKKLLNLELFISKALVFSYVCSISMFSLLSRIWDLEPPPSKLGFN